MGADGNGRLKRKAYEKELSKLHVELVKLQEWVKHEGFKVCIVFEGRDGAGKGGTIKAITERVSPRVFRVVALPAPTEREKTQFYAQRYMTHLPAAGEVVIFDRSWYNRAGVERVMGFASEAEVEHFLDAIPRVEHALVQSRILLLSTTDARSGSSRPWTSSRTAAGTTTPARGTRCSPPPTCPSRPGTWSVPTTSARAPERDPPSALADSLQGRDAERETAQVA